MYAKLLHQEILSKGGLQPEFSFLCDNLLGALVERLDAQVNVEAIHGTRQHLTR